MGSKLWMCSLFLIVSCASGYGSRGFVDPELPQRYSVKKIVIKDIYEYDEEYSVDKLHKEGKLWSKELCSSSGHKYRSCLSYVELPDSMIHVVRSILLRKTGDWNYQGLNTTLNKIQSNSQKIKSRTLEFQIIRRSCFKNLNGKERFIISECVGEV